MEKLVVVIMGQNCDRFIGMCLESVKDADAIVFCDGGSTDKTKEIFMKCETRKDLLFQLYDQEDKEMNGKQRNFYLNYVKEKYPDYWCLALDADEVVEDLSKIKELIQTLEPCVCSVKMRHFEMDLGHEDATVQTHHVLNRLFKVSKAKEYPLGEHPVLQAVDNLYMGTDVTTIWHLAYMPGVWEIKKRYENHMKKSEIHSKEFLKSWYYAHLFGTYPKSQVNPLDIPEIILNEFGIDKDELYFQNRGLETKHFLMTKQWADFVSGYNKQPINTINCVEYGCGFGPYGVGLKNLDVNYLGIELSRYAVDKNPFNLNIVHGNILDHKCVELADLILCIDVLEHLEKKDINKALKNLQVQGAIVIFSIPFIGDHNLEADKTHKTKETKEWWINKISEFFEILPTPSDWLFSNQIIIGRIK